MIDTNKKAAHFGCDCGWPEHGLSLHIDDGGFLSVYVVNSRHDLSLWQRLKSALRIIKGEDHALSEVILNRYQAGEFVDFVNSINDKLTVI
jgi:hypothetical protein